MPPTIKVVDYEIVKSHAASRLQAEVKVFISKGWTPLGAPFCTAEGEFYQAIILQA